MKKVKLSFEEANLITIMADSYVKTHGINGAKQASDLIQKLRVCFEHEIKAQLQEQNQTTDN